MRFDFYLWRAGFPPKVGGAGPPLNGLFFKVGKNSFFSHLKYSFFQQRAFFFFFETLLFSKIKGDIFPPGGFLLPNPLFFFHMAKIFSTKFVCWGPSQRGGDYSSQVRKKRERPGPRDGAKKNFGFAPTAVPPMAPPVDFSFIPQKNQVQSPTNFISELLFRGGFFSPPGGFFQKLFLQNDQIFSLNFLTQNLQKTIFVSLKNKKLVNLFSFFSPQIFQSINLPTGFGTEPSFPQLNQSGFPIFICFPPQLFFVSTQKKTNVFSPLLIFSPKGLGKIFWTGKPSIPNQQSFWAFVFISGVLGGCLLSKKNFKRGGPAFKKP